MNLFEELIPSSGYVIGEIACGHEGDPKKLVQLIDCVVDSGCKAIKFQMFKAEERAIEGHKEWEIFSKLEISNDVWIEKVNYAKQKGLHVFLDIYGKGGLEFAETMDVSGYKLHSEDLLNSGLILEACRTGKIVIIGVGAARRVEISTLLKFINENIEVLNIVLMTGVQTFPTPVDAHSITEVEDLIEKYSRHGVKVGFSDHVAGDQAESFILPFMALAKGASIIEKHVTVNRRDKWIDYHSAIDATDFKRFIALVESLKPTLKPVSSMTEHEKSYRKMFKKSPVFVDDFKAGYELGNKDILFVKDTDSPVPVSTNNLIGARINKDVNKSQTIRYSEIENRVGAIIVVRCASSRLPSKAVMKIHDRESIALVIERVKRCKNLSQVVLATTNEEIDDQLVDLAKREGIESFRGPSDNVALRYFQAAKYFRFDHFVRITGDAVLSDDRMIDKAIESHMFQSNDVTCMKNMPLGTGKEVVRINTLETIVDKANVPANTEYLEYYLENDRYFNVSYVDSNYEFNPNIRATLDYQEDLEFFKAVYGHFYSSKPDFSLEEAINWLNENEDIVAINSHKIQKTPINLNIDISLNI